MYGLFDYLFVVIFKHDFGGMFGADSRVRSNYSYSIGILFKLCSFLCMGMNKHTFR